MVWRNLFTGLLLLGLAGCSDQQAVKDFKKGAFNDIQQRYQNTPHLIVFWSQDCAYCLKEFGFFANALAQNKQVKLITVATDPTLSVADIRQIHKANQLSEVDAWVFADPIREKLYFDVDKSWRSELPFMIFVDKDNTVTRHLGAVKREQLLSWLEQQS